MENELDLQELQEKPQPKRSPAKKPSGFDTPKRQVAEPVKKVKAPKPAPAPAEPVVAEEPKPEPVKVEVPNPAPAPAPAPAPVSRRKDRVARPRRRNDGESNRGMRIRY